MTDCTTKALLLAIAIGLWANVTSQWLRPVEVHAQTLLGVENAISGMNIDLNNMATVVRSIDSNLGLIQTGKCANRTIC